MLTYVGLLLLDCLKKKKGIPSDHDRSNTYLQKRLREENKKEGEEESIKKLKQSYRCYPINTTGYFNMILHSFI